MGHFDDCYEVWLSEVIQRESGNHRRRELLEKGLGHGTVEFLRHVWFPAVGNFDHLEPEWEVRDFANGYRYLDLAYMPRGAKGGIEIQGYGPHARDLDVRRFKDLCRRHSPLALDGWVLTDVSASLSWMEAETVRLARLSGRPRLRNGAIGSQSLQWRIRVKCADGDYEAMIAICKTSMYNRLKQ